MYDELIKALRNNAEHYGFTGDNGLVHLLTNAADAIEELQATLCNWCGVCPENKRDLSTCEIYESCRAKPQKEE